MNSTPEISKVLIRIDLDFAIKLSNLGHVFETQSDVVEKLVDHAHVCDKWWLERDDEDES